MKTIYRVVLIFFLLSFNNVYSANFEGDLIFYDPQGNQVIPPGVAPITGVVDFENDILVVDPFFFFGAITTTNVLEILPPGTYTRIGSFGETLSATIPPGHTGAYLEINWLSNIFNVFMGWLVTSSNTVYTPIDVDGDGVPGMMMLAGPFAGISAVYEFIADPSGPGVKLDLLVDGGHTQECEENGGSEVMITALPQVFGGASLDAIRWTVDGEDAGEGFMITPFLSLGDHHVEAIATTTTGETGSANVDILIEDTTPPSLEIAFLNKRGEEIEMAGPGPVQIQFAATDVCDPNPVVTNKNSRPFYGVPDDNVLHLPASEGLINLLTTGVRVSAEVADASGNRSSGGSTLLVQ